MSRPRNSLPLHLKYLKFNPKSELYEATENELTYKLTFTQMNDLKSFYKGSLNIVPTFYNWYTSLKSDKRKFVIVEGLTAPKNDGFYPDVEYA